MQHIRKTELMNSTALILKEADGDDPNEIVTKALEDLTKTMNERLEAVEKKTDTTKLEERLDKIEADATGKCHLRRGDEQTAIGRVVGRIDMPLAYQVSDTGGGPGPQFKIESGNRKVTGPVPAHLHVM